MLSDAILSMIIVSITGVILLAFKLCYLSKCRVIKCKMFNCCDTELQRDTTHEQSINMSQTPNQI